MPTLRIGCLGWGSLLWDPRTLPTAGPFRSDGPGLPIEFSRVALDGRVTLVIDPAAKETPTYWAPLSVATAALAIEGLGVREKISRDRWPAWIGLHSASNPGVASGDVDERVRARIAEWLGGQSLDAVVWTALPTRGPEGAARRPVVEELLSHLDSLEGEARLRAEEYIRRAPKRLRTPHRMRFEEDLGWICTDAGNQD